MAQLRRSSVFQWLVDLLGAQNAGDGPPSAQIVPSVQPTLEIGPRRTLISRHQTNSATGTTTILTVPSDKDFYLTYVTLTITQDATCDGVVGILSITQDGVSRRIVSLPHQPLTAGTYIATLTLSHPIKVDRGTAISCNSVFTAGTCTKDATIGGYVLE